MKTPTQIKPTNGAAVARLRVIPEDETFSTKLEINPGNANYVDATFAAKASDKSKDRYEVKSTFDFTGVTADELKLMASRQVRIDVQRDFRVMALGKDGGKALEAPRWRKISVRELLDRETTRGPVDPVLAVRKNLEKLGVSGAKLEEIMKSIPTS